MIPKKNFEKGSSLRLRTPQDSGWFELCIKSYISFSCRIQTIVTLVSLKFSGRLFLGFELEIFLFHLFCEIEYFPSFVGYDRVWKPVLVVLFQLRAPSVRHIELTAYKQAYQYLVEACVRIRHEQFEVMQKEHATITVVWLYRRLLH